MIATSVPASLVGAGQGGGVARSAEIKLAMGATADDGATTLLDPPHDGGARRTPVRWTGFGGRRPRGVDGA